MNPFNKTTLVAALPFPLLAGCMTPGAVSYTHLTLPTTKQV